MSLCGSAGLTGNISVQDYLKGIAKLEGAEGAATVTSLAQTMGVTKPSVTQMLRRLSSEALIVWEPRKNIRLTKSGRIYSNNIIRTHRILEVFFSQILQLDLLQAHTEAEKMEHAISREVVEKMFVLCGKPGVDPHGQVIPNLGSFDLAHLRVPENHWALSDLAIGVPGRVTKFIETSSENLREVLKYKIKLQDKILRLGRSKFSLNGKKLSLSPRCMESVIVAAAEGRR